MFKKIILKRCVSFSLVYIPGIFILLLALLTGCPASSSDSSSSSSGGSNSGSTRQETPDDSNAVTLSGVECLYAEYDNQEISLHWTNTKGKSQDSIKISWSSGNGTEPGSITENAESITLSGLDISDWYTISIVTVDKKNKTSAPVNLEIVPLNLFGKARTCFILSPEDLNAVHGGVEGYDNWGLGDSYILMKDINLSTHTPWVPIGLNSSAPFKGEFNGNGYTITGLTIDDQTLEMSGLFGFVNNGVIKNLKIDECSISGKNFVGGITGCAKLTTIDNCSVSGDIKGEQFIGGITGNSNDKATIKNCYSSAKITGTGLLGGLAGYAYDTTIKNSYAITSVAGSNKVGGLIGMVFRLTTLTNCYAVITANGKNDGDVISDLGGLIGTANEDPTISNCFYGILPTPATTPVNNFGTKVSGENMLQKETFSGWNFDDDWDIDPTINGGYPFLR